MAGLIKEAVIYLILFISNVVLVSATVTMQCDSPVNVGSTFHITVTHQEGTAQNVGYKLVSTYTWRPGRFYTFNDVIAPNVPEGDYTYMGASDLNGDQIADETSTCLVHISKPNTLPSVSITPSSPSVSKGTSITLIVSATDNEGLNLIQAFYNGGSHDYPLCGGAKSCSHIFPDSPDQIIVNSDTTFMGVAIDSSGAQAISSTPVTVTNSPPSFITTQSYFNNNPATPGVSKTWQIQASDAEGDTINYALVEGSVYGMSIIPSTGVLTWPNPDSTKSIKISIFDGINYQNKDFTLPVSQCTADVLCPLQLGVCAGSKQTCSNGQLSPASCSLAYAAIPDYQSAETSCDGKDNNCNGQTDENNACACIDNDKDGFNQSAPNCGPADCDDDKSKDPSGCPTAKSGCEESTSKCALCTYPDSKEYCDFMDNNCDGQKN